MSLRRRLDTAYADGWERAMDYRPPSVTDRYDRYASMAHVAGYYEGCIERGRIERERYLAQQRLASGGVL